MPIMDIEYRFSGKALENDGIRRTTTGEMDGYMKKLTGEMSSAGILTKYNTGFAVEGERNMVYINGRSVAEILDGLEIKYPEMENEGECGSSRPKVVVFDRPVLDWNREYIEDIPDIMMKNAISKAYVDASK
jgi:hypothetical protein